jgi:alpha-D-ribose 1-methylphosphonate 5-phosphate C-P lyase
VILDDAGRCMFVCSDTDHCEQRRSEGYRGALSGDAKAASISTASHGGGGGPA